MRFSLALLAALAAIISYADPIRIVGSDLLSPVFDKGLKVYADREERPLTINLEGSRVGLTQLQQKQADIGLLVFAPDTPLPSGDLVALPVAYFTAVLAVQRDVPISQLSYEQIGGIYGDSEQHNHRRWGDVGAAGTWATRRILAVSLSRRGGIAFDLLSDAILKNKHIKPTVLQFDSVPEVVARVDSQGGGVAVLAMPPPESSGLKVVSVSKTSQSVAYPPTSDNLENGDYPLRLPLYLVFHKSDVARLNPVLRFLLGDGAVPLWTQADLIVAPVRARNQLVFDLEVM